MCTLSYDSLTHEQAKLPEELEEYLDQVDVLNCIDPSNFTFNSKFLIIDCCPLFYQFEVATDTRLQFTTTGRLSQTFESLKFLDE